MITWNFLRWLFIIYWILQHEFLFVCFVVLGSRWLVLTPVQIWAELQLSIHAGWLLGWSLCCFSWMNLVNTIIFQSILLKLTIEQRWVVLWLTRASGFWLEQYLCFHKGLSGAIPADAAGRGCSSPGCVCSFINADKLQKCNIMKWILGAVRLQILHYERICCSEGFGCTVVLTLAVSVNRLLVTDSSGSQACSSRQ